MCCLIHPDNHRIRNLCWKDQEISPDHRFVLATNSYRINGGGNFPVTRMVCPVPIPEIEIKSVLRDYLTGTLSRDSLQDAPYPWWFSPMPDTHTLVRTGSGAIIYLPELDDRDVKPTGQDRQGFLTLSLPL